jgi:hypothetical protein
MRGLGLLLSAAAGYSRPLRQPGVRAALQLLPGHPCWCPLERFGGLEWLHSNSSTIDYRTFSSSSLISSLQRRGVFGIGEESGDISKRHQERKLIGFVFARSSILTGLYQGSYMTILFGTSLHCRILFSHSRVELPPLAYTSVPGLSRVQVSKKKFV